MASIYPTAHTALRLHGGAAHRKQFTSSGLSRQCAAPLHLVRRVTGTPVPTSQQIELRLYAIIFISIDYTHLYVIIAIIH
jgi:hypothetical protein